MEAELMPDIEQAKELIKERKYGECEALLCTVMFSHPHDAVPHNLMGLMLEKEGRHADAMCHFRAAYALDPSYAPSKWNIDCFGGYAMPHGCAYTSADCR